MGRCGWVSAINVSYDAMAREREGAAYSISTLLEALATAPLPPFLLRKLSFAFLTSAVKCVRDGARTMTLAASCTCAYERARCMGADA